MKTILRLEELVMFLASAYGITFLHTGLPVWLYPFIFFLPDVGMAGYLLDKRTGAFLYNIFHHKGIALCLAAAGWFLSSHPLILAGLILFSHASFDRIFGFGLKYNDDFKHTHLGYM